jgi:hypothetical protein
VLTNISTANAIVEPTHDRSGSRVNATVGLLTESPRPTLAAIEEVARYVLQIRFLNKMGGANHSFQSSDVACCRPSRLVGKLGPRAQSDLIDSVRFPMSSLV